MGEAMRTCYCVCVALMLPMVVRPEKYQSRQQSLEYDEAVNLMETGENLRDQAGSQEKLELTDANKVRNQAKIKSLRPVKRMKDVISLDGIEEIEEISPIDADLALKMKAKALTGSSDYSNDYGGVSGEEGELYRKEGDLYDKVMRLYKLFDINSLDDIIRVVPIRSLQAVDNDLLDKFDRVQYPNGRQQWSDGRRWQTGRGQLIGGSPNRGGVNQVTGGGRGYGDHNRGGHNKPGGSTDPSQHHKVLDTLNRKISVLEDDNNARLNKLLVLRQNLVREEDLLDVLDAMLERERAKIDAVLQVKKDHLSKARSIQDSIGDLQKILETKNNVKIRYLTKLEDMADLERQRQRGDGYNNAAAEDKEEESGRRFDEPGKGYSGYNPGGHPSNDYNNNDADIEVDTEDVKSLNSVEEIVPVKEMDPIIEIDNIAKIQDDTYLTDEQGEELKGWQTHRDQ